MIARPRPGCHGPSIAWFGIRGIGSIYYLMYAIAHGVSEEKRQAADGADLRSSPPRWSFTGFP